MDKMATETPSWSVVLSLPCPDGRLEVAVRIRGATWQDAQAAGERILSNASVARVLEHRVDPGCDPS